jgi:hypothetical protein
MKILKYLVIVGTVLVNLNGYSQGIVGFNNTAGTAVMNSLTGLPAAANLLRVGLYYNLNLDARPDTLVADDSFTQAGTFTAVLGGGLFLGNTRTIPAPAAPGSPVLLQVRAWSSTFATYEEAFNAGFAGTPGVLVGHSILMGTDEAMRVIMGGGTIGIPSLTIQGGMTSFAVAPVPEPSMIALSLLGGLGAMMLLRRRK